MPGGNCGIRPAPGHGIPPAAPIPWKAAAANALNGVGRIGTWPLSAACVAISICRDFSISPLFGGVILFSFRTSSISTIELSSSSAFESYSISDSADAELCGVFRSFFVVELVVLLESFNWWWRDWWRRALRCNDAIASGVILWWARLFSVWCVATLIRLWCFKLIGDANVVVMLGDRVVDAGDDATDDGRVSASNESTLKLLMRLVFCCCKMCGTVGLVMAVLTGVTVIPDDFIMNFFKKSMLIVCAAVFCVCVSVGCSRFNVNFVHFILSFKLFLFSNYCSFRVSFLLSCVHVNLLFQFLTITNSFFLSQINNLICLYFLSSFFLKKLIQTHLLMHFGIVNTLHSWRKQNGKFVADVT